MPCALQCFEDSLHERYPDQRVCLFKNLVVHNNTIYFVSRSVTRLPQVGQSRNIAGPACGHSPALHALLAATLVPPPSVQIVISWEKYFEGDQLLQLQLVKPEALPRVDGPVSGLLVFSSHPARRAATAFPAS